MPDQEALKKIFQRLYQAARALSAGKLREFGRLMLQSHESLRDDFEVSCAELDIIVQLALQHEGVSGVRMTGGGFGGCTVNLVRTDVLDSISTAVLQSYEERTGKRGSTYVVEAADGASEDG